MLRIALYLVGIIVLALGITLKTKTNLGVSPIISIPYAVAQIFGYETGTAVFVAYLIFIVLRIVLLKGKFPPFQLLQVAASYLTSAFITIFDRVLPVPEQMGSRLLVLALAIGMIGAGRPVGIGIGTVVAMVCTGRVIALFNHFGKKKIEEITRSGNGLYLDRGLCFNRRRTRCNGAGGCGIAVCAGCLKQRGIFAV